MPIVALVLFAVFAALGFGWRSWEQRRRTGSTGFRGISGRPGSIEWLAGVGFIVSMAAAVFAPILQLVGVVSPLAVLDIAWIQIAGIVIAAAGIAATVYAQLDMGDSWRIGVDRSETTTLVRSGVFGWVRNPIFTAMMVFGFGIALVTPNLVAIVGFRPTGGHDRASGPRGRRALLADRARLTPTATTSPAWADSCPGWDSFADPDAIAWVRWHASR